MFILASTTGNVRRPSQSPIATSKGAAETTKSPPINEKQLTVKDKALESSSANAKVETQSKAFNFDAAFPPTQTPASGIVRSVSDYKTSELAENVQMRVSLRKSRTDVFHPSPG